MHGKHSDKNCDMQTTLLRHRRDQIPKDVGSEKFSRNDYNKIKTLTKKI